LSFSSVKLAHRQISHQDRNVILTHPTKRRVVVFHHLGNQQRTFKLIFSVRLLIKQPFIIRLLLMILVF